MRESTYHLNIDTYIWKNEPCASWKRGCCQSKGEELKAYGDRQLSQFKWFNVYQGLNNIVHEDASDLALFLAIIFAQPTRVFTSVSFTSDCPHRIYVKPISGVIRFASYSIKKPCSNYIAFEVVLR